MLIDTWAEREEAGLPIEQQILKARQQGISTVVEGAIAKKVNFGIGVKAAIASYDQDAAERMFGMTELAFNEMPSLSLIHISFPPPYVSTRVPVLDTEAV